MKDSSKTDSETLGPREIAVLATLLKFTVAMVLLPLAAFFICKRMVFEGFLGYSNGAIGGAVVTVIIIHVIIFMYVRIAIREDQPALDKKVE